VIPPRWWGYTLTPPGGAPVLERPRSASWAALVRAHHEFEHAASEELHRRLCAAAEARARRGRLRVPGGGAPLRAGRELLDRLSSALAVELLVPEIDPGTAALFGLGRRLMVDWALLLALDEDPGAEARLQGWAGARLVRLGLAQRRRGLEDAGPARTPADAPDVLDLAEARAARGQRGWGEGPTVGQWGWRAALGGEDEGPHQPLDAAIGESAIPARPGEDAAIDDLLTGLTLLNGHDDPWRSQRLEGLWRAALPALDPTLGLDELLAAAPAVMLEALGRPAGRSAWAALPAALVEAGLPADRRAALDAEVAALYAALAARPALLEERARLRYALRGLDALVAGGWRFDAWPQLLHPEADGEGARGVEFVRAAPRVAGWLLYQALHLRGAWRRGARGLVRDVLVGWGYSPNIYNSLGKYLAQVTPLAELLQARHPGGTP
jgi:hypothetical protein